jgi:carboxyl-terminal processing protease
MKKLLGLLFFFLVSIISSDIILSDTSQIEFENLMPENQHKRSSQVITHILTSTHYQKRSIDDSLSSEMYDRFLEKLDYAKLYFLQSDIEFYNQYRYDFDEFVESGKISIAYDIFNLYQQRMKERLDYVFTRLETEFDYSIDEDILLDRSESPWAKAPTELDEIWRKRLKDSALRLNIAGKEWEAISKTLTKRYKRIQKNISQLQSEDVFQLLMNSFTESFDPHTNYFSPKNFDDFKISLSQAFEGIGARLTIDEDYTMVSEIIVGGPADKGNQLFANDKIIGVAQGDENELVDVIGWRLDDVVQLIRGKKGTTVNLQVLRADAITGALPDTISIIRDKIKLKDQTAYSDTLEVEHEGTNFTFGVITIPTFYSDFDGKRNGESDYKSTSRDVKILLEELKHAGVDGIVIDLRRNGGGFLNEAVDLTGLFIDSGPVVQVKDSRGRISVEWDNKSGVVYDGPLAVIINRFSASASEIFAAAIQDYGRGIIIGGQSFGKGTVQRPINLNQILRSNDNKFGQIKLTTAKFYRVNGGSTQHIGVTPDISFPSRYNFMEIGESKRKNALLWDQINSVNYSALDANSLLPQLETRHDVRLANDSDYKVFLEELSEFEKKRNIKTISLNYDVRKKEIDESKNDTEKGESDEENSEEETKEKKKDFFLEESTKVLGDYLLLSEN